MFKSYRFYIKVYKNEIEVINLKTGEALRKRAATPFSIDRFILAEVNNAKDLLAETIRELTQNASMFMNDRIFVIQPMEAMDGGLADIEKRAFRDVAEMAGGTRVKLIEHSKPLSVEEALEEIKRKE